MNAGCFADNPHGFFHPGNFSHADHGLRRLALLWKRKCFKKRLGVK